MKVNMQKWPITSIVLIGDALTDGGYLGSAQELVLRVCESDSNKPAADVLKRAYRQAQTAHAAAERAHLATRQLLSNQEVYG